MVWPAATTVRRSSVRRVSHSACQRAGGAFVAGVRGGDVEGRGEAGAAQRGATDERGEHRVRLVRHRRRPCRRAPFGELADLGPAEGEHVGGDAAPRIGAARRRVAEPGDRGSGGVPRRRGGQAQRGGQLERQRGGRADRVVEVAGQLDGRGHGAGGAADLHRQDERRRRRRTRRGRRSASPPPSARTSWARRAG